MLKNVTAHEVVADAFKSLSRSALVEIADHCEHSIQLALKFTDDHMALLASGDYKRLVALRNACRDAAVEA